MLINKFTRTTISIPEDLLFEIKKKALEEKKTIKDVFIDGLRLVLRYRLEEPKINSLSALFGAWGKGERGSTFLIRTRNTSSDTSREVNFNKLWKKS